jgi:Ca-activated chloride channel family protein
VIAFESEPYVIAEVQSAANKGAILDRISAIEAGGGTSIYPGMEVAFDALKQTQAKLKHVIVLTDGISEPGDFEGITRSMSAERMTVSTVAVGDDADRRLLEQIAEWGKGRHYYTDDPASVPQIFAKETVTASKSALHEQPFAPQLLRPTQVLADIDLPNAPLLLGYVTTRPKPTAELILVSEKGDPVLAWWRYGLGMSVAFTSDAKGRWAADWLNWPGFSKFWAQVARHAMRKSEAKGVAVQVQPGDRQAAVTVDAVDLAGRFVNQAEAELVLVEGPGQAGEKTVPLAQTAPGHYQGSVPTPEKGEYHFRLAVKQKGQPVAELSRGLTVGFDEEFRLKPTDEELLRKVAEVSGGRYNPPPEELFTPPERSAERAVALWPYLLAAALILFLADVALRRIDFALLAGRGRSARRAAA